MSWLAGRWQSAVAGVAILAAACGGEVPATPSPAATGSETPVPARTSQSPGDPAATASRTSAPTRSPAAGSPGCGVPAVRGDSVGELTTEQGLRSYRLHVPAGYHAEVPAPLVLNFHGYGESAAQQEAWSGLAGLAGEKGFILVTPEGSGSPPGWNIPGFYNENGIDDVLFVEELVADLSARLCIDGRRIFATGHSNGGEMAAQVACFLPNIVAAAAPVAGPVYQGCEGRAVPILTFQGTDDHNVTYEESATAVDEWAVHNGCPGEPAEERLSEHVTRITWRKCRAAVVFIVIEGMGHTWPGATLAGGVGPGTEEIDASEVMWEFFARHAK